MNRTAGAFSPRGVGPSLPGTHRAAVLSLASAEVGGGEGKIGVHKTNADRDLGLTLLPAAPVPPGAVNA